MINQKHFGSETEQWQNASSSIAKQSRYRYIGPIEPGHTIQYTKQIQ